MIKLFLAECFILSNHARCWVDFDPGKKAKKMMSDKQMYAAGGNFQGLWRNAQESNSAKRTQM
jgi:hypothetical protein